MAKLMSYTNTRTGAIYPESVWVPTGVYIDAPGPDVRLVFGGYKDIATAAGAIAAGLGVPGAVRLDQVGCKEYHLTLAQYQSMATSAPSGATLLDAISKAAYAVALACLDTPSTDDPAVKVSFFHDATDADLNLGG